MNKSEEMLQNIAEPLRQISLPEKDKEAIFNTLRVYTAAHPIKVDDDVPTRGLGGILEIVKQALAIRFRF